jgi:hypothetical protein
LLIFQLFSAAHQYFSRSRIFQLSAERERTFIPRRQNTLLPSGSKNRKHLLGSGIKKDYGRRVKIEPNLVLLLHGIGTSEVKSDAPEGQHFFS